MTDANKTLIAALIDRSGSMSAIRDDAQGGYNSFIEEQKKEPGELLLSLSDFDHDYTEVYSFRNANEVEPYVLSPRGATALCDSLARLIVDTGSKLAAMSEDERPGTVIVLVITDGHENSSQDWTGTTLRALVKEQKEQWNWQFIFLGSNIDAVSTGADYGFDTNRSMTFANTSGGVAAAYATTSGLVVNLRGGNFNAGYTDSDRSAAADR